VIVAGLLAVGLIASGVVRGATTTGDAPLVDIVSEDQAIAALGLYAAQVTAIEDLRGRSDIYANPGPGDAATAARRGAARTQKALEEARAVPGPDPLAAAYYRASEHSTLVGRLDRIRAEGELIALLTQTHDTLYSGTGSIALPVAYEQITGAFAGARRPRPLAQWAQALVEQMEERDRRGQAGAARQEAGQLWAARVDALEPAAVGALRLYIDGLPAVTVEGLRGHPVAGTGLAHLERQQRQVSSR